MSWVTETRMVQLCGVARSTWQSWVREALFTVPAASAFQLADCLEVLLASVVREHFSLTETRSIWEGLRKSGEVTRLVEAAEAVVPDDSVRFDLVIDPAFGEVSLATDDASLASAILTERPRLVQVVPLSERIRALKAGFERIASDDPLPTLRRGRPPRASAGSARDAADVIELGSRR